MKEGADGGEANIAAARADTTLLFQIVEKRADNWCIDIFEQQTGRLLVSTLLFFVDYFWPWGWAVGGVLLLFSFPNDAEKRGYHDF